MPVVGRVNARLAGRSPIRDGLVVGVILFVVFIYTRAFLYPETTGVAIGGDLFLYQRQVQNWLGGMPAYPAYEVAGSYTIINGVILYPPITILAFAPTLFLPLPLWWLIPLAIFGNVVWRLRPGIPWLLVMAYCLTQPISIALVVVGNPDIWLVAGLSLAVYWRPAAAFVLLKPSLFPFALVGLRSRGWWVITGVFALVSLALFPQTLDWLSVIRNGQGVRSGLTYSFDDVRLLAVPLLAWAGSSRGLVRLNQSIDRLFGGAVVAWPRRREMPPALEEVGVHSDRRPRDSSSTLDERV